VHGVLFWLVRQQLVSGSSDFRIFYTAGLMLRRGEGRALYSTELQSDTEREIAPAAVARGGHLPYNHPPFEAAFYVVMTYLRYFSAYRLWVLLNMLLLAGSVFHIRSHLPTLLAHFREFLILVPLAFFPITYALMQGQDSILLMALYCLGYSALRQSKDLQAGVCLGLGLFKFHLVLPFAFILLLHRRWRALTAMFVIAVIESAVSWAIVGGWELLYYPHFAWQINRQQAAGVIVPANMPNLRGLFTGWQAMSPPPYWIEVALLATSVGFILWASRQWRPLDLGTRSWDCGFSICLVASYMVGYHGYSQDMSFLLLPLLLTLDQMLGAWRETSAGFKLVLGFMFLSPLYLLLTLRFSHLNLFAIVLLFLAGYLAAGAATVEPQASASTSTARSSAPLP
jgi:hypothetical protein